MKEVRVTISTTHVDRHGDRITLEAFRGLVDGSTGLYFPVGVEHDPRIAPVGRLKKVEITELEDGEFALVGTSELFEPGNKPPYDPQGRLLPRPHLGEEAIFGNDRNFQDPTSQRLIEDIASLIKAKPQWEVKKALDPIAVLTIGFAGFAVGAIATGFFNRLGEDAYVAFKRGLKRLLSPPGNGKQERLLRFQAHVESADSVVEVNVILTNPSDEDLELLFAGGLTVLDESVRRVLGSGQPIHSITYEFGGGELSMSFALRKDCVPIFPKEPEERDS